MINVRFEWWNRDGGYESITVNDASYDLEDERPSMKDVMASSEVQNRLDEIIDPGDKVKITVSYEDIVRSPQLERN